MYKGHKSKSSPVLQTQFPLLPNILPRRRFLAVIKSKLRVPLCKIRKPYTPAPLNTPIYITKCLNLPSILPLLQLIRRIDRSDNRSDSTLESHVVVVKASINHGVRHAHHDIRSGVRQNIGLDCSKISIEGVLIHHDNVL